MKKYVRFQEVSAEPCTRHQYKEQTGIDPIPDDNYKTDYQGYTMLSANGFQKWMRKDTFDNLFAPSETWMEKLQIELSEVSQRIDSLMRELKKVAEDDVQYSLIQTQMMAMQTYANIMAIRLNMRNE